ncbi:MAG: glycosyltransferase family 4 protein [Chloroflexota bacterium]|nr:glycosyltransferase family 4 protein [Chloroflexota bacterium]
MPEPRTNGKLMRILFVSPELPNEFHRIRALNLLKGLGQRHEIDLISLAHRPPSPAVLEALRPFCRRIDWVLQPRWRSLAQCGQGLLGAAPLEACFERSPALRRLIHERLASRSFDLLYVKRLRMAQYGIGLSGPPRVLDLTDAMTRFYDQLWRRARWPAKAIYWEEWRKHRSYEARVGADFGRCLVASPVDAIYLQRTLGAPNVEVVPNAVDTDFFQPRPGGAAAATFLLSGLMDKLVNVDAAEYLCDEVWPRVRDRVPGARLRLVGPQPSRAVRALAGRPGVQVVGLVPDLRDEIAQATAVLVPLRLGTGTKNKVLQALAMGRPVVTTSVGNEGLNAVSGEHLLVADSAADFAQAIVGLAGDGAWRATLGAAGRAWVVEQYGLGAVVERLEGILAAVVSGATGATASRAAA